MGMQMLISALIKALGLKIDPTAVEAIVLQVIAEAPKLIANANMALAIANQRLSEIERQQAEIFALVKQNNHSHDIVGSDGGPLPPKQVQ